MGKNENMTNASKVTLGSLQDFTSTESNFGFKHTKRSTLAFSCICHCKPLMPPRKMHKICPQKNCVNTWTKYFSETREVFHLVGSDESLIIPKSLEVTLLVFMA